MKIGILIIATGTNYHQYIDPVIESAQKYLLPNHTKEFLLWTDSTKQHKANYSYKAESVGMPWATLLRYHNFLSQEEQLRKYDYLFYCDVDMLFVDTVGEEILGTGITATQHPGYAFPRFPEPEIFYMPFEPNKESAAYVAYPKYYFAGGFQGGTTESFIQAMHNIRRAIDSDLTKNYIARWHDESHWNRYLWENPPSVILDPSYCYPVGYPTPEKPPYTTHPMYQRIWGRDYSPKLMCLTKKHTLTKEGGDIMRKIAEKFI